MNAPRCPHARHVGSFCPLCGKTVTSEIAHQAAVAEAAADGLPEVPCSNGCGAMVQALYEHEVSHGSVTCDDCFETLTVPS